MLFLREQAPEAVKALEAGLAIGVARERRATVRAALNGLATDPSAAIDSLLALRVDAIESAPTLAAALAPAIDALRSGRDATPALVRARRVAAGVTVEQGASAWGGAW